VTIQDHCHIQLKTGSAESGAYHVRQGTLDDTPLVPATIDRALNMKLHLHCVLDDAGAPRRFNNAVMQINFASKAEIDVLVNSSAREVYYIPHDHSDTGDESGHIADRRPVVMLVKPGSVTNIDTSMQYWTAAIEIIAND